MDDLAVTGDLEPDDAVAEGDLAELLSLKEATTFIVADAWGDVRGGAGGLFGDGTRLLSRFRLLVGDKRPSRLNYGLSPDSAVFTFNGANMALPPVGGQSIPRGVIHLERKRCLAGGRLHERLRLTNYGLDRVMAPVSFEFAVDFRDIFEVRGMRRATRGRAEPPRVDGRSVAFAYVGLDNVRRESEMAFSRTAVAPLRRPGGLHVFPGARRDAGPVPRSGSARAGDAVRPPFRSGDRRRASGVGSFQAAGRAAPRRRRRLRRLAGAVPRRCRGPDHRPGDRAPIHSPASRGFRRRSVATASSPPGRCCGWILRWPKAS